MFPINLGSGEVFSSIHQAKDTVININKFVKYKDIMNVLFCYIQKQILDDLNWISKQIKRNTNTRTQKIQMEGGD